MHDHNQRSLCRTGAMTVAYERYPLEKRAIVKYVHLSVEGDRSIHAAKRVIDVFFFFFFFKCVYVLKSRGAIVILSTFE